MSPALRRTLLAMALVIGAAAAVAIAWRVDVGGHEGRVLRRVTLAGRPVGNLREHELARVVARLAADLPTRAVEVRTRDGGRAGGFTTDGRAFGLRVSQPATVRAVIRLGRTGPPTARIWAWMQSFRGDRHAPLQLAVDRSATYATVAAEDPGPRRPPVEPTIAFRKGAFVAVPGQPGRGIDAADVIDALPEAARGGDRIVVEVRRGEVAPQFPLSLAERLAGRVQGQLVSAQRVSAGGVEASVPLATVRSWVTSEARSDGLHPALDGRAVQDGLRKLLPSAGEPPVETRFTVEGGTVVTIPGTSGTQCCAEAAVARLQRAVFAVPPAPSPVDLPLTERPPKLTAERAAGLNISEPVGTFTTRHKGGEPRVRNIHRIADMVRGSVIEPGKTFSVNETVGKRTAEKGFVSAPAIENGVLTEDVGGGVSQFATTLFNAAFFAGLDFGEYQSHSLRISRYPYGREATMGFPHPDLVLKNTTPHGVLIWPTYTATTITVTLYSTRILEADQTGQSEAPRGACTRVTTERTRRYLADGRTEVDKVYATYRPGEGVNC